jgi:hypothetical protein
VCALAELNIEIICANSSQAKGRVERVNRTLQDRLVKELRLANISDIDAGNAFLPSFLLTHNERFAVTPVRSEDMHRPLSVSVDKLTDILCHREQRYVGSQLILSYDRKRIILERNANSEAFDFQEPYLFHILAVIGLTDVTFIHAENQGREEAALFFAAAAERIGEIAIDQDQQVIAH